ncbi:MAG: sterol desaturase family protein, partial [Proteobacteria bacterium]|nr:sterol desaturase family protein [Pseudomonadota bacterium]
GLALGLLAGHVAQEIAHHALHTRPDADSHWLLRRFGQHRLHHLHYPEAAFGTLTAVWDHVFGTAAPRGDKPGV